MMSKKRVCYVVCYKDPNYIRTITLVDALKKIDDAELLVVKNKYRGLVRYIEVPAKLLIARMRFRPQTFIVGFRGHECFWLLYPIMAGKRIIFDEFINLHDWLVQEHSKFEKDSYAIKILDKYMEWIHKKSAVILTDTEPHARLSSEMYGTPIEKIHVVPVGADEQTFYDRPKPRSINTFGIFFFGNMLPLHGLDIILAAIKNIAETPVIKNMHFTIVGGRGDKEMIHDITNFIKLNKLSEFVTHKDWIPYNKLPDYIAASDICLGGPFGDTSQAGRVVTGKTYMFLASARAAVIGDNKADDHLINKVNCLSVELGDANSLAESISWAYKNQDKLKEISKGGRKLFVDHYSSTSISIILQKLV